jgi:hypothetical protein
MENVISLPEALATFNGAYNSMLDMDESTEVFQTAVRLRNNILNETHAHYTDILKCFEAGTLENKFKASQL